MSRKYTIIVDGEYQFPNKPIGKVGRCYKSKDNKYYYQRETDVLFINPASLLISSNSVGFLHERDVVPCKFEEFTDVLNDTIFKMNILNNDFKTNDNEKL